MQIKDADYRRMIHSARWVKLRRELLMACPLCVDCKAAGFITPATEIHHCTPYVPSDPLSVKEAAFFDKSNLVPLCRTCHLDRHASMHKQTPEYYKAHVDRALDTAFNKFL